MMWFVFITDKSISILSGQVKDIFLFFILFFSLTPKLFICNHLGARGARKSLILRDLRRFILRQKETRPTTRRVSTLSHLPLTNYKAFNFIKFESLHHGGSILIVRNALQVEIIIMLHDCAVCVGSAP